jgi:hypothetical protein
MGEEDLDHELELCSINLAPSTFFGVVCML